MLSKIKEWIGNKDHRETRGIRKYVLPQIDKHVQWIQHTSDLNKVSSELQMRVQQGQDDTMMIAVLQMELVADGEVYSDNSDISEWAKAVVSTATSAGLMNGYEDGTLKPKGNTTRAETVTVMLRALKFKI
ncbi:MULTISPECIES: S-layer homology domain-containing protein [unclassified Paenibacillus]|uniref:S-layer homology domain-containing protein n=1 Tax=unclassified Paenibacillus TaxID=185978 RepID=UPI001AE5E66D|nr:MULTISPECIES: S-layer homology domain-containing protein [unclassified Paenibacillus]MBP1157615.1 hypothetical protein [Paenibacillus sp. PvP091]MBP1171648.1 hypothetical protein [Paenibacillus sp. PvR098]MBP2438029.1 hypothetical protein [Paenibacillus sp. PvP052]